MSCQTEYNCVIVVKIKLQNVVVMVMVSEIHLSGLLASVTAKLAIALASGKVTYFLEKYLLQRILRFAADPKYLDSRSHIFFTNDVCSSSSSK